MPEVWKPVPDGSGGELVSDHGRFQRDGVIVPCREGRNGYRLVEMSGKRMSAHRLVLRAFAGEPPFTGAESRHLDGDRTNNHADNLAWGDRRENARDKVMHGTDTHSARLACARRGHALVAPNLVKNEQHRGARKCYSCHIAYSNVIDKRKYGQYYDRDVLADGYYAWLMEGAEHPLKSAELLARATESRPHHRHPGPKQPPGTYTPCVMWVLRQYRPGTVTSPAAAHDRADELGVHVTRDGIALGLRRAVKRGYFERVGRGRYRRLDVGALPDSART